MRTPTSIPAQAAAAVDGRGFFGEKVFVNGTVMSHSLVILLWFQFRRWGVWWNSWQSCGLGGMSLYVFILHHISFFSHIWWFFSRIYEVLIINIFAFCFKYKQWNTNHGPPSSCFASKLLVLCVGIIHSVWQHSTHYIEQNKP